MIAVSFALPDESRVFIRRLRGVRTLEKGPLPVLSGSFGKLEIIVFHTGVGLASAHARLSRFLAIHKPRLLLCSGFAVGLDPSLQLGDLIVSTNFTSEISLPSAHLAFSKNSRVHYGSLTTQLLPAESVSSKHSFAAATGALAVDMETSAIFTACADASVPMLSLRVISDTASQSLPVPFSFWFDPVAQRVRPLSLLVYLLYHPSVIPPFIRFVRGVFKAKKALASSLSDYLNFMEEELVHTHD